MKLDLKNDKYKVISCYAIGTFAVCLLMVIIVQKFSLIMGFVGTIIKVLSPIIWGIVIAYIGNPIMMKCDALFIKLFEKKKPHPKIRRAVSVTVTLVAIIAMLTLLISMILPNIVNSIISIFGNTRTYFTNVQDWINNYAKDYPEVMDYLNDKFTEIEDKALSIVSDLQPKLVEWAGTLTQGVWAFAMGLKDFLLGFCAAIYLLAGKEKFLAQLRKITCAVLPKKGAQWFMKLCSITNRNLGGFISGKLVDSLIIGILCFIGMHLMKMPYVVLISFIIGVTNIIPFFGPFIGAIPSALLILLADPYKCILFIIFILILQQFDGNILGPKILGETTGLPAFWVMTSIFIGGGLFGFIGMLLGVPVFAVIYSLISDGTNLLLKKRKLPVSTSAYYGGGIPENTVDEEKTEAAESDKDAAADEESSEDDTDAEK